ncbi:Na-translocating system protein MpsC family protein [Ectobacillus funiculus]
MVATQEDLLSVSSSFSRIIKRGIGKGPEACYTVLKANRLYVYIRNFMTPAEEILTDKKEYNLVMKYRSSVIAALSDELLQEASQL